MSFYILPQEDLEKAAVAETKDLKSAERQVRDLEGIFAIVKVVRYASTQMVPETKRVLFKNPNARGPRVPK